jgi:hypothetical protein
MKPQWIISSQSLKEGLHSSLTFSLFAMLVIRQRQTSLLILSISF